MGMTTTFVKKGLDVHSSQMDNGSGNKVLEARSTPEQTLQQVKRTNDIYDVNYVFPVQRQAISL